jgi:hypothetical protein
MSVIRERCVTYGTRAMGLLGLTAGSVLLALLYQEI